MLANEAKYYNVVFDIKKLPQDSWQECRASSDSGRYSATRIGAAPAGVEPGALPLFDNIKDVLEP